MLFILTVFSQVSITYAQNNPPVVENVTASQRTDGSKIVDIYYDISDADGDLLLITLMLSEDGGETFTFTPTQVSGDIGNDIDLIVVKDDISKANIILENDFGGIPKLELSKTPGETKSVCDKLAGKRLYYCQKFESSNDDLIPQVEIYPGFSQVGEEYVNTYDIIKHRKSVIINNFKFFIPSVEHRLLISCTHGLFRHGILRISELHNSLNWFNEKINWDLLDNCIKKSGVVYPFKIFLNHIFKYSQIKGVDFPIELNHFLDINQQYTDFHYPFKPNTTSFALLWIKKAINDFKNGKINSGCRSLFLAPILASIALSKYKLTGKTGIW